MPLDELFPNSTVMQVIFQIRYPNLFYLESRIGDFQLEIIEKFPESSIVYQRPLMFVDLGNEAKIEFEKISKENSEGVKKVWRFTSPNNFLLNVQSDSLDITSQFHKTYNNPKSDAKFRDVIEFVTKRFFEIMKVPLITRIGLRYIDECPLVNKDNTTYKQFFNSGFNLERFDLSEASETDFVTVFNRDDYSIRYAESMQKKGDEFIVILDFDGFSRSINPSDCLQVADRLHEVISQEFVNSVKEPLFEYMRKSK